jgi:hypothetical protein
VVTDIEADAEPELDEGHILMAELLYEARPTLDLERLAVEVNKTLPSTVVDESEGTALLVHQDLTHHYDDGEVPILTALLRPDEGADHVDTADYDLSQTWNWADAGDAIARCTATMAVVEMMGQAHVPKDRVSAFRSSLLAVVAQTQPLATWWPISEHVAHPEHLDQHDLAGLVNVRLFRVDNAAEEGELVMDTLGLGALGIPDVQCHFHSIDPAAMARQLFNLAAYLYNQGDVVADGETVTGIGSDDVWRCEHQVSLVEPNRVVLDVDPGPLYAAGTRP